MRTFRTKFLDANPEASHPSRVNPSLIDIQKKRSTHRRNILLVLAIIVLFCGVSLLLRWLIWSNWFQIKEFEVDGLQRLNRQDVIQFVTYQTLEDGWWHKFLGPEHILIWPSKKVWLQPYLLPLAKEIDMTRDFSARKIIINVQEFKPIGIWCRTAETGEQCAWFDAGGTILDHAPTAEGNLIPVVWSDSSQPLAIGRPIFDSPDKIKNLLSIFNVLDQAQLSVREMRLGEQNLEEMDVSLNNGPELYFSLRFPADTDLGVINDLMQKNWQKFSYVDFRIQNRAYYK